MNRAGSPLPMIFCAATVLTACGGEPCPVGSIAEMDRCLILEDAAPDGARPIAPGVDAGAVTGPGGADGGASVVPADGGMAGAGDDAGERADGSVAVDAAPRCVPAAATDLPDRRFTDTDCDGIDGALADAVLVVEDITAAPAGAEARRTITAAINRARVLHRSQVLIAAGTHAEQLELVEGVSLYGGYLPSDGWRRSEGAITLITGPAPVVRATAITAPTKISMVEVRATDAVEPGASSIAAWVVDSDGLTMEDMAITAGRGAAGRSFARPAEGASGAPVERSEAAGVGAACHAGIARARPHAPVTSPEVCGCGNGGAGGPSFSTTTAGNGLMGGAMARNRPMTFECATSPRAPGGRGQTPTAAAEDGQDGADGVPGRHGSGGWSMGHVSRDGIVPRDGANGTDGYAGGGGGGGGAALDDDCGGGCIFSGAAGGSGGPGGCGGLGGHGGSGGGASIGLLLWNSDVRLNRVDVVAVDGGDGGDGARGGVGGAGLGGGLGGGQVFMAYCDPSAPPLSHRPGAGGDGGDGGDGGNGGGGGGGPSIGVLLAGGSSESADSTDVSVVVGAGGRGGGGGPGGNSGADGLAVEHETPI